MPQPIVSSFFVVTPVGGQPIDQRFINEAAAVDYLFNSGLSGDFEIHQVTIYQITVTQSAESNAANVAKVQEQIAQLQATLVSIQSAQSQQTDNAKKK